MRTASNKTFVEEQESFRNISEVFWSQPQEYESFGAIGEIKNQLGSSPQSVDDEALEADGLLPANNGGNSRFGDATAANRSATSAERIGNAACVSSDAFADAIWQELGLDIDDIFESGPSWDRKEAADRLQSLTAELGMEALGCYLPWHAYATSASTPWGVYLFLEKLTQCAKAMSKMGRYLAADNPGEKEVLRRLLWFTYRHELFHFHVEMFATRLESAIRKPVYRPYVERVRSQFIKTPQWWEEALAQAVVINSRTVKHNLQLDSTFIKQNVVPYFRELFPDGYRHFECTQVGGPEKAHRILSAQIARTESYPTYPNTGIAIAKAEYAKPNTSVPGYVVALPWFIARFQVPTPRLEDIENWAKRRQYKIESGKGDHKRIVTATGFVSINRSKRGKEVDLASFKDLARHEGMTIRQLALSVAERSRGSRATA